MKKMDFDFRQMFQFNIWDRADERCVRLHKVFGREYHFRLMLRISVTIWTKCTLELEQNSQF